MEMKTQGHPQLVHAQLLQLYREHWPEVDVNAVIETPAEIAIERSRARMLLSQVSEEERRLLYFLSLSEAPLGETTPLLSRNFRPVRQLLVIFLITLLVRGSSPLV